MEGINASCTLMPPSHFCGLASEKLPPFGSPVVSPTPE